MGATKKEIVFDVKSGPGLRQFLTSMNSVRSKMRGMMGNIEPVNRHFQGLDKRMEDSAQSLKKNTGNMRESIERNVAKGMVKDFDSFAGAMSMPVNGFKLMDKHALQFQSTGARFGNWLRRTTHGLRGFRMEMLGVMFFGMMLQRTLTGLLKPALEVMGVFELWRIMLMVSFLPIVEQLMPIFLDIMEWFIEQPASVKKLIGTFVLFGIALGLVLMVVGQFALGVGSVILMLGPLGLGLIEAGGAATLMKGSFARLVVFMRNLPFLILTPIAIIIAVATAIVYGMILSWREDFSEFKDWLTVFWEGVVGVFSGAWDIIAGLFDILMSILEGDFDGMLDGVVRVWEGILSVIAGAGKIILSLIVMLGIGLFRVIVGFLRVIFQGWVKTFTVIDNWTGGWASRVIGKIKGVIDWIKRLLTSLSNVPGFGFLKGIGDFAGNIMDQLKDLFSKDLSKRTIESAAKVGETESEEGLKRVFGEEVNTTQQLNDVEMQAGELLNINTGQLQQQEESNNWLDNISTHMENIRNITETSDGYLQNLRDFQAETDLTDTKDQELLDTLKEMRDKYSGQNITINNENNVSVIDMAELDRKLEENSKLLADLMSREVKLPG